MFKTWKPPTWKGLIGVLTLLTGVISALTVSPGTLPRSVSSWLIVAGGVLIAVERAMDAVDNYSQQKVDVTHAVIAANAPQPAPAPQPVPSVPVSAPDVGGNVVLPLPDPTTTGGGVA